MSLRHADCIVVNATLSLIISLCVGTSVAPVLQAQRGADTAATPLSVRDVLGIREFGDRQQLTVTSDHRFAAFVLRDPIRAGAMSEREPVAHFTKSGVPDGAQATDVVIVNVDRGSTRNLTDGRGSSWAPVWSPDGRKLAFFSDRDGLARLWIWDRVRDSVQRLSAAIVHVNFGFEEPQWSPDGRHLLVKLLPSTLSLDSARYLAGEPEPTNARRSATPRERVTARVYTTVKEKEIATTRVASVDNSPSFFNASLADLVLIDVASGRVRVLAHRVRPMAYRFAPDGRSIAFSTRQPFDSSGAIVWGLYDLSVVDTAGRALRVVAPRMHQDYGLVFSWSPDGSRLAYGDGDSLAVIEPGDGAPARRVGRRGVDFFTSYRAPLWLDSANFVVTASDTIWRISATDGSIVQAGTVRGRRLLAIVAPAAAMRLPVSKGSASVLAVTRDPASKRMGIARVDLSSGAGTQLFEDEASLGAGESEYHVVAREDGRAIVYVAEDAAHPAEVWMSDADGSRRRPLTNLHPAIAARALGRSRLVSWRGPAGDTLGGALLLPPDFDPERRYPLIVKVYGGSRLSNTVNQFGLEGGVDNLQLLATRGYAVLLPDTPLREGTPLADLAATVLPGVDEVIALGIADPERIGLMGHSYGGYSTLAILVQTRRFRAAVSSGGFSNLFSHYSEMRDDGSTIGIGWSEEGQGRMGDSPWKVHARYLANSPFFALDSLTTPVLLLHGGADRTVLAARATETFVALRRLGKEAELVIYDGEEHHPGSWGTPNAEDYWRRIFAWFGGRLK